MLHEGWWDAPAGAASGISDATAEGYTEVRAGLAYLVCPACAPTC